ncbi:MAG: hypothetical protein AAF734_09705, partial [Bacteroidota bacterium]
FATICDYEAEFGKERYEHFGSYGRHFKIKESERSSIDKRRKQIGLLSLKTQKRLDDLTFLTKFWVYIY